MDRLPFPLHLVLFRVISSVWIPVVKLLLLSGTDAHDCVFGIFSYCLLHNSYLFTVDCCCLASYHCSYVYVANCSLTSHSNYDQSILFEFLPISDNYQCLLFNWKVQIVHYSVLLVSFFEVVVWCESFLICGFQGL